MLSAPFLPFGLLFYEIPRNEIEKFTEWIKYIPEAVVMNYTYIVKCSDGTLYTGWTNDLEKESQRA